MQENAKTMLGLEPPGSPPFHKSHGVEGTAGRREPGDVVELSWTALGGLVVLYKVSVKE